MFEMSVNIRAAQTSAICQDGKIVPFNEGCEAPLLSYLNIISGHPTPHFQYPVFWNNGSRQFYIKRITDWDYY